MRRTFSVVFVLLIILGGLSVVTAGAAPKVDVCHYDADLDAYHLINISDNAFDKHIEHGDAAPGDEVPTMPGYEFDATCVPLEIINFYCYDISVDFVNGYDQFDHEYVVEVPVAGGVATATGEYVGTGGPYAEFMTVTFYDEDTINMTAVYDRYDSYTWYPWFDLNGDYTLSYLGSGQVFSAEGTWSMTPSGGSCFSN